MAGVFSTSLTALLASLTVQADNPLPSTVGIFVFGLKYLNLCLSLDKECYTANSF